MYLLLYICVVWYEPIEGQNVQTQQESIDGSPSTSTGSSLPLHPHPNPRHHTIRLWSFKVIIKLLWFSFSVKTKKTEPAPIISEMSYSKPVVNGQATHANRQAGNSGSCYFIIIFQCVFGSVCSHWVLLCLWYSPF